MSSELSDYQRKMLEFAAETAKWVRFEGIQRAREVLRNTLSKEPEMLAYHFSDGRASTDVARLAGVSDFAVRSYWKKWTALGLVVSSPKYKGRYERIFSLEDLGFEIPAKKSSTLADQARPVQEGGEQGP